jgi:hypothetical protein
MLRGYAFFLVASAIFRFGRRNSFNFLMGTMKIFSGRRQSDNLLADLLIALRCFG